VTLACSYGISELDFVSCRFTVIWPSDARNSATPMSKLLLSGVYWSRKADAAFLCCVKGTRSDNVANSANSPKRTKVAKVVKSRTVVVTAANVLRMYLVFGV